MDNLIMAIGIFINDFPYFMLAMTIMWDHLRVSRRRAVFCMLAMTLAHATSILLLMNFYPNYRAIQVPHEIFFLAVYLAAFIYVVRLNVPRLLFMGFFIKLFADAVTSWAAFLELNLWPDTNQISFGLIFNLMHLVLLLITFPLVRMFIKRQLRPLFLIQSNLWRTLWLVPAVLMGLNSAYSVFNKEIIRKPEYVVFSLLLFIFSLLVYYLVTQTFRTTREKTLLEAHISSMEELLVMQSGQYERLASGIEQTKKARHDLRHQLAVLNGYLKSSDVAGAKRYCEELSDNIPSSYDQVLCDNFAVNALAQHYAALAKQAGIPLTLRLDIPAKAGRVRDADLCIVIGNLLENAIEACGRQRSEKSFIRMNADTKHGHLTITMDNSFDGVCTMANDSYLSRKREGAGVGLASVKGVAQKYDGTASFEQKENVFLSSVLLKT